jgi:DNA polymerase-4
MADGVAGRLRGSGLKAGTIALKLRDSSFRTITRQTTLPEPTDLTEPIYRAATQLLRKELKGQRIRLGGVAASNFREKEQLGLFTPTEEPRQRQVAAAADAIRKRFGDRAVTRARLVGAYLPTPFERDPMTAVERRHGTEVARQARDEDEAAGRDTQADTEDVDIPLDA